MSGSGMTLRDLSDVRIDLPATADESVLVYDSTTGKFGARVLAVTDIPADISRTAYAVYTALLTEAAPATITSGSLVVGVRYTITTFETGDDFTNVGAASNETGVIFIATGTTPADYTNGSTLDSDGAPVATVLQNTLGGTVVWSYSAEGEYVATLTGAFTDGKTALFATPTEGVTLAAIVTLQRTSADAVTLRAYDAAAALMDAGLSGTAIEIRVYP